VRIPRVDQVVDAGLVINPERARSQFEGAAVMGAGLAMFGEISAAAGRVQQSNFNDFRVMRMSDAPVQVNVTIVDSDAPPSGIGEPGTPPVMPALANAIFAATGSAFASCRFRRRSWCREMTKKFCGATAFVLTLCLSCAWLGAVDRAWQTGTLKDVQVKRAKVVFGVAPGDPGIGGRRSPPPPRETRLYVIETDDVRLELKQDATSIPAARRARRRSGDVRDRQNSVYIKDAQGHETKLSLTKKSKK